MTNREGQRAHCLKSQITVYLNIYNRVIAHIHIYLLMFIHRSEINKPKNRPFKVVGSLSHNAPL